LNSSQRKVKNNVEVQFFFKNAGISYSMWIWTWKTTCKLWKILFKIRSKSYIKNTYIYWVY